MKKLLFTSILVLYLLLTPLTISGQILDDPVVFNVSDEHELTAFAEGNLTWDDGELENLRLNLTMSDFTFNNSEIVIIRVVFAFYEAGSGSPGPNPVSNTSQITLTPEVPSTEYNPVFNSPDAFDRFFINITILAYPVGGSVDQTPDTFAMKFPQAGSIIVQRDNIVPVVNLYGFPQANFFQFWLPIYLTFLVFLLTPAAIVGISKIQEIRSNTEKIEEDKFNDEIETTDGENQNKGVESQNQYLQMNNTKTEDDN